MYSAQMTAQIEATEFYSRFRKVVQPVTKVDPHGRDPKQGLKMYSGKVVWPLDFHPEDLDIKDVARGICRANRFVGQTRLPISVGWHSNNLSLIVPAKYRLMAHVHDITEAYLVDLPRPLKNHPAFAFFKVAEDKLFTGMAKALKLPFETLTDEFYQYDADIGTAELLLYNPKGYRSLLEMGFPEERHRSAVRMAKDIVKLVDTGKVPRPSQEVMTRRAWLARYHNLHRV
jgi:hypothetical protein